MNTSSVRQPHTVLGILAHVDAGKTTLSEALLYRCGVLRSLGRVDHRTSFLDTDRLEKERGITIFSKQAVFTIPKELQETDTTQPDRLFHLLDTPGHMDFSAEMERTLSVLDYAILVVSGVDGVQSHTMTLWELLKRYRVPTLLWINKMDQTARAEADLVEHLQKHLSAACIPLHGDIPYETLAMESEEAMEEYLQTGSLCEETIANLIRNRCVFPIYCGSALKLSGVDELLCGLGKFCIAPSYGETMGARVYKITHDEQGNRLTWLKVTGGHLAVRETLSYRTTGGANQSEKITQLRVYSGTRYEAQEQVEAGTVCAVTGLTATYAGQGLGFERDCDTPLLEPVMTFSIHLPEGVDPQTALPKLSLLTEEDPMLRMVWNGALHEIQLQLMGEIQTEILRQQIMDRFGWDVTIDAGKVLYKETISEPVLGAGHFEPLRHYAEVHLLLEPLPRGAGVLWESACSTDLLGANWQHLILTHLGEKEHCGVLTGAPLTDVKITLVAGRAHLKHTEGGDFRQASYRAVRQGLMKAENVLLEPYYHFRLEVPQESLGRAIGDLKAMQTVFDAPRDLGETFSVTGRGPAICLQQYRRELLSYTHGKGRLSITFDGYDVCHNPEQVIEEAAYDPNRDTDNTADSVFCSHGAGLTVKWDKADDFMHLDCGVRLEGEHQITAAPKVRSHNLDFDEKELEAIMEREFGPIKRPRYRQTGYDPAREARLRPSIAREDHLVVDGYNMIFAWDELRELAKEQIGLARERLIDRLANYAAFRGCDLTLVFDGYKVHENPGTIADEQGIRVVYTKEGETADAYIEKLVVEFGKNAAIRVATSDALIQLTALRMGVLRLSARELEWELQTAQKEMRAVLDQQPGGRMRLGDIWPTRTGNGE